MKIDTLQNHKTENHPFRQIAVTSFIRGGISVLFGIIILLTVKADFKEGFKILAIEKISVALGLLFFGLRSLWVGFQNEYDFNLSEVYDPNNGNNVNSLLGQRNKNQREIAKHYAQIIHGKAFSLEPKEKGQVKSWQTLFYKLASQKDIGNLFDFVPYPITNFITIQSGPVALIALFLVFMLTFLFVSYLEIISINMIWINLFILIGLLCWWRPTRVDKILSKDENNVLPMNIMLFVFFYAIAILFFKPYAMEVNISLIIAIVIISATIIYSAILSFNLIESFFGNRERVKVDVSEMELKSIEVGTQPNKIIEVFENYLKSKIGFSFNAATGDERGLLAGDTNRKGKFSLEYLYETQPKIVSNNYNAERENQLANIWKIGTIFLTVGLILFFIGILRLPGIDQNLFISNPQVVLYTVAPKILFSLYFILMGLSVYYFGNKLVYEIYMFFYTEIYFESNLILFGANGNYDEYEKIIENVKKKNTATEFTPDIKVCKVISSIFVHPYMNKGAIAKNHRYLFSMKKDEGLFESIKNDFIGNMNNYTAVIASPSIASGNITFTPIKEIE